MTDDPRIRHRELIDRHMLRECISDADLLYCKALLEQVQSVFLEHLDTLSRSEGRNSPRRLKEILSEELKTLESLGEAVFMPPPNDETKWRNMSKNRSVRVGEEWAIDLTKVAVAELGLKKFIEYYVQSPALWSNKSLINDSIFLDLAEAHLKLGPLPAKFANRVIELSRQGHVKSLQNKIAEAEEKINQGGGSVLAICHLNPPGHSTFVM